jgi:hypothetical protein
LDATLQSPRDGERGEHDEEEDSPARNSLLLFGAGGFHSVCLLNFRGGSIP